jgi:hypothetical protein
MYQEEFHGTWGSTGRYDATLNILASVQATISPTIYAPSPRYPQGRVAHVNSLISPSRPAAPGPPNVDVIYNPSYLMFNLNQELYCVPLRTANGYQPLGARITRELIHQVSHLQYTQHWPLSVIQVVANCEHAPLEGTQTDLSQTSTVVEYGITSGSSPKLDFDSVLGQKNYEHLVKTVFPSSCSEKIEMLLVDFIENYKAEHGDPPGKHLHPHHNLLTVDFPYL